MTSHSGYLFYFISFSNLMQAVICSLQKLSVLFFHIPRQITNQHWLLDVETLVILTKVVNNVESALKLK